MGKGVLVSEIPIDQHHRMDTSHIEGKKEEPTHQWGNMIHYLAYRENIKKNKRTHVRAYNTIIKENKKTYALKELHSFESLDETDSYSFSSTLASTSSSLT